MLFALGIYIVIGSILIPNFAPEVGPGGAFLIFGIIYSGFYLADFILLALPGFLVLRWLAPHTRSWLYSIYGAGSFVASIPLWKFVVSNTDAGDMWFLVPEAALVGSVSLLVIFWTMPPTIRHT